MAEVLDGLEAAVDRLHNDLARLQAKVDDGFAAADSKTGALESKMSTGFSRIERRLDHVIDHLRRRRHSFE
jgi:hypothetical protein